MDEVRGQGRGVVIEIVAYKASWPDEFQEIGARIRKALGPLASGIHHIGSTSVPGMPAKDVIDVQLTVQALEDPIDGALIAIGYEPTQYTQDHAPWGLDVSERDMQKRYFRFPGSKRIHLHVRSIDRLNQRYSLICRDYLRTHPMAAHAYAEIKHQLAKRFPEDIDSYYDIKDPVFDVIMSGGFEWADVTGWKQSPTDV
jgi:GrpB-like predicted nucleotidyltransferase (UPF0157 family)